MIIQNTHLESAKVEPEAASMSRMLMDLLHDYHTDGGTGGDIVGHVYEDGVEVFWVEPKLADERRAVSFYIDREGIQVATGWLKLERR
jgi:hypothetical protein